MVRATALVAMLIATSARAEAVTPTPYDNWKSCVVRYATTLSESTEAADIVARGAVGICASYENAQILDLLKVIQDSGAAGNAAQEAEKSLNAQRSGLLDYAIGVVIGNRIARKQ